VGERFADVNIVNIVSHGGGGVMVWAGISYRQRTQLHFIDGNLNAEKYHDEILRSIVVPLIRRHHLMFQNDNARAHVARICTQFHQTCHPLNMFGMLWIEVYDSVFQFLLIYCNFTQ
jgi:hypothetical protein